MQVIPKAVETFCSYAQEDEVWLRRLETHLSLLKRQGLISLWHNRLIAPGTDWTATIDIHLNTASVILLLVSADFFASEYCFGVEMQRALARQEAGEARVIPIVVRAVDMKGVPFIHLQSLPTNAKPVAMWKDRDRAFADITAGIRRAITEELPLLTASALRATFPSIWNVPYPRNPFFLGREKELTQIHQHLHARDVTALSQPHAISGLGGIGKTQLALEYAYQYHQEYQAVLWAFAENRKALISSYLAFASLLQLPEREEKKQEIVVSAVKNWLGTHSNWLLILDNADDLQLLRGFLPSHVLGHLLLTTRATAIGRLAYRLEIDTLRPEYGALLLLRRAALLDPNADLMQAVPQERERALAICQELGGLPLALDQAGAYLEETGMDLTSYQHLYQQHRADLLRRRGGPMDDHPSPVASTWSLSFQQVEEQNPAAADLLRLCAFLAPDAIAEEILTEGAFQLGPVLAPVLSDVWQRNHLIETLRTYSLIRRDPQTRLLSIHRLVQAVLQDRMKETERYCWVERALLAVDAVLPGAKRRSWAQCERLLPQMLAVAELIERYQMSNVEAGHLLYEAASYLQDRARYGEAEPLLRRALQIWERQLGPKHIQVATALNSLAIVYKEMKESAEAEPLLLRALQIWEQQLGFEHTQVATALNNLGIIYILQRKYTQAERVYKRALRIRKRKLGSKHPHLAYPLYNLAMLYKEQRKYAQAEQMCEQALRILEQQLGSEPSDVARPLIGLAELYREQEMYEQAKWMYERALHILEQQLGLEHPDVARPLIGLAELYREQEMHEQMDLMYKRALHILQQLGPKHPFTQIARESYRSWLRGWASIPSEYI